MDPQISVTLVRQPLRSRCCGQAVCAMLTGQGLHWECVQMGHAKGTKPHELRSRLGRAGVRLGCTQLTRYAPVPDRAVLRQSTKGRRNWHWLLIWDGVVYDPGHAAPRVLSDYGDQITSFMEIGGAHPPGPVRARAKG